MQVDRSAWSGDGDFTAKLLDALDRVPEVVCLRVEDAPASHSGTGYNFLVNEIYVRFVAGRRRERRRWLGLIPWSRLVATPALTLAGLETRLAAVDEIGRADYTDEGMLQYLRTERVVQPYQTRGYKLVELVRIYAAAAG